MVARDQRLEECKHVELMPLYNIERIAAGMNGLPEVFAVRRDRIAAVLVAFVADLGREKSRSRDALNNRPGQGETRTRWRALAKPAMIARPPRLG